MRASDTVLPDGRTIRSFETGPADASAAIVWHPGTPHTGRPPAPLVAHAERLGLRLVSITRPGFGGSTPHPGRTVASAARDALAVLGAAGVTRAIAAGYSGGGPHALALAALAPELVGAVVAVASPAPFEGDTGVDGAGWFAGMRAPGGLLAARDGRAARLAYAEHEVFDPEQFLPVDWAALEGEWGAVGEDAQAADAFGPDGAVDDDVAFVNDWDVELAEVSAPVLLVHGTGDRVIPFAHTERIAAALARAELHAREGDGHVAVLAGLAPALDRAGELLG
ncbi:alpha/beta fold hydrolase [Agromyces mediolanus]|uniref:alpha/beta fold hydrolase n=1 Tax=Agromyces mediolanus TaxID=41986 RepID=UPI001E634B40|nr:alpha/beta fold hydrolase [Agromyces mediolanus]MCD1569915.1 alpha/beta hydrolase [Agromyces mediolanus]